MTHAATASPSSIGDDEVVLTAAMRLLSDYEDAIDASIRHALVPGERTHAAEAAHLVEAAGAGEPSDLRRGEVSR